LAAAKATVDGLTPADYLDFSAVTTAMALPETNNTEKIAKTTAINDAIAALVAETSNPLVVAGVHQDAYPNWIMNFTGTASDNESGIQATEWTKQSGPGTVTFGSAGELSTTASGNSAGTYVLRLTATDMAANSDYDETNLIVHRAGDINNDGLVNEDDFTLLMFNWGDAPVNPMSDYTRDGLVNEDDFTILMYWFGSPS
jgi:hypothetical protein